MVKSWWRGRIIPIWRPISVFIWKIAGILAICCFFKYVFLTNCLKIQSITFCATAGTNDSSTLLIIGSLLFAFVIIIPTFWIESKVKDEVNKAMPDIFRKVREDMEHLSEAQILIFNAGAFQSPSDLLLKEILINKAVDLWPAFKQVEYRKLGDDFSRVIIDSFYSVQGGGIDPSGHGIRKDQISPYVNQAIFYLEQTVVNAVPPERDGLVNLACMYGCAEKYDLMIRTIEQAVRIDDNARDDFQDTKRLSLLILACGSRKSSIEKLGKKIGMNLPLSKQQFTKIIKDLHLETANLSYPKCYAIKKVPGQTRSAAYAVYIIKFFSRNDGASVHSAQYFRAISTPTTIDDLIPSGQEISVDDFFEKVDQEFFAICLGNA